MIRVKKVKNFLANNKNVKIVMKTGINNRHGTIIIDGIIAL